jgi:hypothetical protein
MDKNSKSITYLGAILGTSFVISALIFGLFFYNKKTIDNTLTVTGSAKKTVTSDLGKLVGSFSRTVTIYELKSGYEQMANDLMIVKDFFIKQGVDEKLLVISPVFMDQQYKYDSISQAPTEYMLRQTIELQLKDVNKITQLSIATQTLIKDGVLYSTQAPEYYYTDLAKTRINLLGEAVKDAKARADKIAQSGGQKVRSLNSASVGVTQVTSINSIDSISDYGAYDTSKIEKEVMITVKTIFSLK